jgi:rhodanese-related sulfurtransferase
LKTIAAKQLNQLPKARSGAWIDVRSANEYAAGHIPGAVNIPLEQLEARVDDIPADGPLLLICKAGTRARIASGLLPDAFQKVVLEGGTDAWINAGFPVVQNRPTRWSLERQVRLAAGLLVLAGVLLAFCLDPRWVYFVGLIGAGLTFAGLTDFCPMGLLLASLPWNRARTKQERSNVRNVTAVE